MTLAVTTACTQQKALVLYYSQTGTHVMMVSRTYCLNHEDFEHETTLEDEFEDYDIFEPSADERCFSRSVQDNFRAVVRS